MNNKSMQKESISQAEIDQQIKEILTYNVKVKENLKKIPALSPLQEAAIQNFKYRCQRENYTDQEYNNQVELFNRSGLLLQKRGVFVRTNTRIGEPYLDSEAIHISMNKFRERRTAFNKEVDEENLDIVGYNEEFVKLTSKLTLEEKETIKEFKKTQKGCLIREYNKAVEIFNPKNDFIVPKKKLVKLKNLSAETVISVVMVFYGGFFKQYVAKRKKNLLNTSCSKNQIPKLQLNISSFAKHNYKTVPRLDVSAQTIRNHFKILREAGIITNYKFTNWQKPVFFNINEKILFIKDANPPKTQYDVNQFFKSKKAPSIADIKGSVLLNIKKEKKYNDVLDIGSLITGSSSESKTQSLEFSTRNTRKQECEKQNQVAPKILARRRKISENARLLIMKTYDLALNLENHSYKGENYIPLRKERIASIRNESDLSWDEMADILTQDFVKTAYKNIYQHHQHKIFVGEWYNAIQNIKNEWIIPILNGIRNGATYDIYDKMQVFRWKFVRAGKFFKRNPDHNPLFPVAYFDLTRTTPKEMGFKGLDIAYKRKLEKDAAKKITKKKKYNATYNRKKSIRFDLLMKNALQKFFKGDYSLEELQNYVHKNLGGKQQAELANYIRNNSN